MASNRSCILCLTSALATLSYSVLCCSILAGVSKHATFSAARRNTNVIEWVKVLPLFSYQVVYASYVWFKNIIGFQAAFFSLKRSATTSSNLPLLLPCLASTWVSAASFRVRERRTKILEVWRSVQPQSNKQVWKFQSFNVREQVDECTKPLQAIYRFVLESSSSVVVHSSVARGMSLASMMLSLLIILLINNIYTVDV